MCPAVLQYNACMKRYQTKDILGFIIPSVIGIVLFMVPVHVGGTWTIIVKVIADVIGSALGDFLPLLCALVITVSAVLAVVSLGKPSFITSYPVMSDAFATTPVWAIIRVVGAIFAWIA